MEVLTTISELKALKYRSQALQSMEAKGEHNRVVLQKEKVLCEKSAEVLKLLLQRVNQKGVERIQEVVSHGLTTVFQYPVKFKIVIDPKKSRVDYHFELEDTQKGYEGELRDAFGGSIMEIVGFLLRMLFIVSSPKPIQRFVALDEDFSAVDVEKVPLLSNLIRTLCEKMNFDILLITHNPAFSEDAHNVFNGSFDGGFKIKKV